MRQRMREVARHHDVGARVAAVAGDDELAVLLQRSAEGLAAEAAERRLHAPELAEGGIQRAARRVAREPDGEMGVLPGVAERDRLAVELEREAIRDVVGAREEVAEHPTAVAERRIQRSVRIES